MNPLTSRSLLPWQIKPGMLAEVPHFAGQPINHARVESVVKARATFVRGHVWKVRFPAGTWPVESIMLHGKSGTLLPERWNCLVPTK